MVRNKIRRSIVVEQLRTVRKLFVDNGIDLDLVEAGRTLYQSLRQAKIRTKKRKDYIAKGIQYKFKREDKQALLELIQGDDVFWQAWIKQHKIFEKTGLKADRPTIHRLDSDGHYEFGNIAVVSRGEHNLEHAKAVIMLDTEAGKLTTYKSQTAFEAVTGISSSKTREIKKALEEAWSVRK